MTPANSGRALVGSLFRDPLLKMIEAENLEYKELIAIDAA